MNEDEKLMQRAYGHTVAGDPALTAWIESDDFGNDADESRTLYGEEAAEAGRNLLAQALGGHEAVDKVLAGPGRPSLSNTHAAGRSPHRQVRLGNELDSEITTYASETGQSISAVIRQVLQEWVQSRGEQSTAKNPAA